MMGFTVLVVIFVLILLIVILWFLSLALKIAASGVSSLHKLKERLERANQGGKTKDSLVDASKKLVFDVKTKASKLISTLATTSMRMIAYILDALRWVCTAILPFVLVLDIVIALVLTTSASGFLLLLSDDIDYSNITYADGKVNNKSGNQDGRGKVILVGDSRSVQLAMNVLNMSATSEQGPRGNNATVVGTSSDGDYVYAQGSVGLDWLEDKYMVNRLYDEIKKDPENTAVVFNMGTNDIPGGADPYITYLNDKGKEWVDLGCAVYFLSCNPVNESLYSGFSNADIENFNNGVKDGMDSSINYLDSYSELKSQLTDTTHFDTMGVHYDKEIYEKIWQFIVDNVKGSGSSDEDLPGSTLGERVYNESLKHVDKCPYVWGGADIDPNSSSYGADCSGFVMALYEKCGYSGLPHNADAYQTIGVNVPKDNAKAGDILCFSGHVAISDGKGGQVHESQPGENARHDSTVQSGLICVRRIVEDSDD